MEFFDCNCYFGRSYVPGKKKIFSIDDLKENMDFVGIDRALIHHIAIRDESPVIGNRLTVESIRDEKRFEACWGILPPQTEELGSVDAFISAMGNNGVKALKAFPGDEHRYLLNGLTFGPLFEEMIARNIPLLLGADWQLITALLKDFPKLTVIALQHGPWGEDRYFRPLIEAYDHLFLDTSRYELDGGLEDFCRRYGGDRLLFGTATPEFEAGGPLLHLLHADLPGGVKERIAGANLTEILGAVDL